METGETINKITTISGAALAAAAFTFAIGTTVIATPSSAAEGKVLCYGISACKGQGACKTASNACKSQRWINASAADCRKWGGKEP